METREIIANNLKEYRDKWGYNQDHIANYLGLDRSIISLYENAKRDIPFIQISKLANLFAIDIDDLFEENSIKNEGNFAFAFRSDGIHEDDLKSISEFHKVIKNYLYMKKLITDER